MTQKKRKILGGVLAALVLMTMFAVTVFAGDGDAPSHKCMQLFGL